MSQRYEHLDGEKACFSLAMMGRVLWEVSRSGNYVWRARPAAATVERRRELQVESYEIFCTAGRMRSGYRRVQRILIKRRIEPVRDVMRDLGSAPVQSRPRRKTTIADPEVAATAGLVGWRFAAERIGQAMAGDITYIRACES